MKLKTLPQISVILPCRNEERSLNQCLVYIHKVFQDHQLDAEVIVSDSSSDRSAQIAKSNNTVLVKHDQEGYGIACLKGFEAARGKYLFLADCDGSYDFREIPKFIEALATGHDFVIGNRFGGIIEKGAMPWHHQYIGNPVLSFILRLIFQAEVFDAHCGMRALTKEAFDKLSLNTKGMEFASEMIVKAKQHKFKIKEIPINYHKRIGQSKLRSFVDGWRHLRFMISYSTNPT